MENKEHFLKLKLKIAKQEDFIEFSHFKADKKSRVFKMKLGHPFWCINSKGIIEEKNYCIKEHMDKDTFRLLLSNEQILVCDIEDVLPK